MRSILLIEESINLTKNARILVIGEIFSFVLSLGLNLFLIRVLSIEDYSYFNRVLVIPIILSYVADFGLFHGCVYYVARLNKLKKEDKSLNVIRITLIIKSVVGIVISFIIFFISHGFISPLIGTENLTQIRVVQLSSILFFTRSLLLAVQSVLIGSAKMKIYTILNIIKQLTGLITTISLVLLNWILFGPVIGLVLSTGVTGLLGLLYIRKNIIKRNETKQDINWKCLPKLVKKGFSFSFISVVHNVKYEVFILILSIFSFYSEVSYIKVGVTITSMFYIILRPVEISLFPIFSKYSWKNTKERTILRQFFQYSIKFLNIFLSPVLLFCIIFSSSLIPLIFGVNYIDSTQFIMVFLIYFLPVTIGIFAIPIFFYGQGHSGFAFFIEFFSFIASIVSSIFFSIFLGSFGFVIGICFGAFLGLIFGILITNRKFGKELFSKIKESILILVIASLLCGLFFLVSHFFNLITVLDSAILKLLVLGAFFLCYYLMFIIILLKFNLITYKEMIYFVGEFEKIPLFNKVLPFIVNLGKKLWKKNNNSA
ncbi:hypothetical protein LCGC14_0555410 [marine sediment metagenome]|uniref:Polysaccharide biosynthesis protein C-terminal domain-containing protein n=1 Tax=marine sediment metagenome TaxID=412755 RepID=A0A0F9UWU6_9ZZZZ